MVEIEWNIKSAPFFKNEKINEIQFFIGLKTIKSSLNEAFYYLCCHNLVLVSTWWNTVSPTVYLNIRQKVKYISVVVKGCKYPFYFRFGTILLQ